ncbi:HypC/HybG/HupF family hydrogenase formation chaperone [Azospirillum sp. B506]|uniref:HypC/HybG/HupF family hydrogenase formation chaperone n=1 Tax=Azospirillum sp. B506 TaxID=137721 RepID=UPI00034B1155|nr:HypC/HybG/HupF family hydrogenase formation chaperone [Azospirillum sp. B506]
MCLAVPALVTALLPDDRATVSLGGVTSTCSLELVEGVTVGDYVIVHVGYALSRLDAEEAERTLALLAEVAQVETEAAEATA